MSTDAISGVDLQTSIEKQQEMVEKIMMMQMMQEVMKKQYGDGMEFEMVYQAMMDSLTGTTSSSQSQLANLLTGEGTTDNTNELVALLNNALNYNTSVGRTSITGNTSTSSTYSGNDSSISGIYSTVNKYAKQYGVDSNLILAVIKAESDFDTNSVSSAGAVGLMQLMPSNLSAYGVTDGTNADQNIKAGTQMLKELLNTYGGDISMALMAYNAGQGTMQRRGVSSASDLYKMPTETQNYVPKVLGYYNNGVSV